MRKKLHMRWVLLPIPSLPRDLPRAAAPVVSASLSYTVESTTAWRSTYIPVTSGNYITARAGIGLFLPTKALVFYHCFFILSCVITFFVAFILASPFECEIFQQTSLELRAPTRRTFQRVFSYKRLYATTIYTTEFHLSYPL